MFIKRRLLVVDRGRPPQTIFPLGLKHRAPVAPTGSFCRPSTSVNLKDELDLSHSAREQVTVTIDEKCTQTNLAIISET